MYTNILIRFGELYTKGKNRKIFIKKLSQNIKRLVTDQVEVFHDRIFIPFTDDNMENLNRVFGIQSFSPVVKTNSIDEDIKKVILNLVKDNNDKTFKAAVKRSYKEFPFTSMEYAANIGGFILKNFDSLSVDVKSPDFKVEVEIKKDFSYVFVKRHKGQGGYPTGVNGKVLHLISGGIDSPVAAYEMMKRGVQVDYLNFITPPHTDELTKEKVHDLLKLLAHYQGGVKLYRSNYTDLMNYIGLVSDQSYKITLMRRSFYRIAEKIALRDGYLGISNGDNLGQVASQTLESINVISRVAKLPIYRPILTADKLETIKKGELIGTYKISIRIGNEACELFAPKSPVIKPKVWIAEKLEEELSEILNLESDNLENNIESKIILM